MINYAFEMELYIILPTAPKLPLKWPVFFTQKNHTDFTKVSSNVLKVACVQSLVFDDEVMENCADFNALCCICC